MSNLAHAYACYYYNKGLERAKVRDLYGATIMLRRSVEMDKKYSDSRILLGLCLFEVGEVGEALAQWMIAKKYNPSDTRADYYISTLRSNPGRLSTYRAAIRKFNSGLELMKQEGDDLALIQLKKAVSKNPNYVRAWQLLALLYLRARDYTRARKCLKRSLKTDIANPVSLRYLKSIRSVRNRNTELAVSIAEEDPSESDVSDIVEGSHTKQTFSPKFTYEEGRPDYRVFISLVAGILLGIVVVYYLIVPGVKQTMKQDMAGRENSYGNEIAAYLTNVDSLEKENSALQSKLEVMQLEKDDLASQIQNLSGEKYYDNIINSYVYYLQITDNEKTPTRLELFKLKQKLLDVSDNEKESASAKQLYDRILEALPGVLETTISGKILLEEGKTFYDNEDYATANEYFRYAYEASPDNDEILYLLGRTYQLTGDDTKALKYYKEYAEKFPEGEFIETVDQWLAASGV